KDTSDMAGSFTELMGYIDGELTSSEHLSNGDKVTFVWNCDEKKAYSECGVDLSCKSKEFLVSGLTQVSTFDPFYGLDVEFSGDDGDGVAKIVGTPANGAAKGFTFVLSKYDHLKNGEKVTLSFEWDYDNREGDFIEEYNCLPSVRETEFGVSGLTDPNSQPPYVDKINMVSVEQWNSMKKYCEKVLSERISAISANDLEISLVNYLGCYFMTPKMNPGEAKSTAIVVYQIWVNDKMGASPVTREFYWCISFSSLISDGTIDVSDSEIPNNVVSFPGWSINGYTTLDDLYNSLVVMELGSFDAESDVKRDLIQPLPVDATREGFIFPDSDIQIIDPTLIVALSDEDLRMAINEIWARNGYVFRNKDILDYYKQFSWYNPTVSADEWDKNGQKHYLNDIEMKNIDEMTKEREKRKT
ncbi:MAG: YARHG domain-containing protein, partial [Clostridiales bacterium]|nr:YARHG domain-containing protein [Clostridiales bacterium]